MWIRNSIYLLFTFVWVFKKIIRNQFSLILYVQLKLDLLMKYWYSDWDTTISYKDKNINSDSYKIYLLGEIVRLSE